MPIFQTANQLISSNHQNREIWIISRHQVSVLMHTHKLFFYIFLLTTLCESIFTIPTTSVDWRLSMESVKSEREKVLPSQIFTDTSGESFHSPKNYYFYHPATRSWCSTVSTINCGEMRNGLKWAFFYYFLFFIFLFFCKKHMLYK